jgi:hypothetical protein
MLGPRRPAAGAAMVGVATVLKMKVFLLIGCCLPKIHIHSIWKADFILE